MHYYSFNIADYRKDTAHLSLLEHGIYRSLLDTYYLNEGVLCADDAKLMRSHSVRTADEQQAYKNVISDFFVEEDGVYKHDGCDKVLAGIFAKSQKARESAQKRWEKNAGAMRTHSERNANGMLPITQYPLPNNPDKEKKKKENPPWAQPTWVNEKAWAEFEEHRKEIKKPLTNLSRTKAANQLEGLTHEQQQQVIDKSIQGRWAGLFPNKLNGANNGSHQQSNPRAETHHQKIAKHIAKRVEET